MDRSQYHLESIIIIIMTTVETPFLMASRPTGNVILYDFATFMEIRSDLRLLSVSEEMNDLHRVIYSCMHPRLFGNSG